MICGGKGTTLVVPGVVIFAKTTLIAPNGTPTLAPVGVLTVCDTTSVPDHEPRVPALHPLTVPMPCTVTVC